MGFATIDGPCLAIDDEMSIGQIRQKKPMISKAPVFDGSADGIWHPKKYFSLCVSLSCRLSLIIEWEVRTVDTHAHLRVSIGPFLHPQPYAHSHAVRHHFSIARLPVLSLPCCGHHI